MWMKLRGVLMDDGIKGRKMPNVDILVHSEDGYEIKALNYAANLAEQGICAVKTASFQSREESLEYARKMGICQGWIS